MKRLIHAVLVVACSACSLAGATQIDASQQASRARGASSDPLSQVSKVFPGSISINANRRLIEFCPDNTCDGFIGSRGISVPTLKDFAYLYIYFFSDFGYLASWRSTPDAKKAAHTVLAKAEYRHCATASDVENARCVLMALSRNDAIRLAFIRYDEGERAVVAEDIDRELSKRKAPAKQ